MATTADTLLLSAMVTFVLLRHATCTTINETTTLYDDLTVNYNSHIRPAIVQDDAVEIFVDFRLLSLQDFDDLTGLLKMTSSLSLEWIDPRLRWRPSQYGNATDIVLNHEDVWSPDFITLNAPDHDYVPGQNAKRARIDYEGWVRLQSFDFIEVICSVEIDDYPYDTQSCKIVIIPWGYLPDEVTFLKNEDDSFSFHIENAFQDSSAWSTSDPKVAIVNKRRYSGVQVTLTFTRRYAYVIANLIIPVFILSFLNTWVFLLPPESGERISFSITVFLSFAVYMTILSDHMPKGSEPLAKLNYQMVVTMLYSVSILFCTIVSLRTYNNIDKKPVPGCLAKITKVFRCKKVCSGHPNTIASGEVADRRFSKDSESRSVQGEVINATFPYINSQQRRTSLSRQTSRQKLPVLLENGVGRTTPVQEEVEEVIEEITWVDVGVLFDRAAFIVHTIWWFVLVLVQSVLSGTYQIL